MEVKLKQYKEALAGFSFLVKFDLKSLDNKWDKRLIDGIENGMIKKFEVTIELCWKLIKRFLMQEDGIDAKTPKQSVKEFYISGYMDEEGYLKLIDMIDDRNKLSHLYDETAFRKILTKFPGYLESLERVSDIISERM